MAIVGETLALGAPERCDDCGTIIVLTVCESAAGHYVGAWCKCGPYCRESGYYPDHGSAEAALKSGDFSR
jgi:hypothetical protein